MNFNETDLMDMYMDFNSRHIHISVSVRVSPAGRLWSVGDAPDDVDVFSLLLVSGMCF